MDTYRLFALFVGIVLCSCTSTVPVVSIQCSPSEPRNDCCYLLQWSQSFQEAWFDVQFYCLFTGNFGLGDSSRNVFPLCMEKNVQNVVNGQKKQESVSLVLLEFELHHCFGHYVANAPGDRVQFLESRDELVRKIEICGCFDPANRWTPEDLSRTMPLPTRLPLPRHHTSERLQYVRNVFNFTLLNNTLR